MKKHILVLALGSAMVLSACGGGGGSSGGGSTPAPGGTGNTTPTPTLTTIDANNANSAAANAYAATTSVGASSASLTDILGGVSVTRVDLNTVAPLLKLAQRAYGGPALLAGVTRTDTCSGGGTVSVDATVANPSAYTNGDKMTLTATNCVESGQTLNGKLAINFSGVSGSVSSGVFGVTMDSVFTGFAISAGSDKITVDGDMKLALNQTSPTASSLKITGNSLKTVEQSGSTSVTRNLTGYTVTGSTEGTTSRSAADFGLSGNSPKLGNFSYTVKNLAPFVSTGNTAPTSGSLIVNGVNSTSVTATAVSNGVKVDFGSTSNTLTWAAFLDTI